MISAQLNSDLFDYYSGISVNKYKNLKVKIKFGKNDSHDVLEA